MAENEQLEAFLKGEPAPEERASAPAQDAPQAAERAPAATEAAKPETPSAPATEAAAADPDDDGAVPELQAGDRPVPLSALEGERTRRKSWVERASRAEAERDLLRKQLEDARKAAEAPKPEPPRPVAPFQPIDPARDPVGYHARVQEVLTNERLNWSEGMLTEKIGPEKVGEYVAEFKKAAERDPSLYAKLYAQPAPYQWMAKEVDRLRLINDIGEDPTKYEEKLRAKWEAERAAAEQAAPPAQPAKPNMQPSLVNARSAAPRSSSPFTGPPSMDDIVAGIHRRPGRGSDARH